MRTAPSTVWIRTRTSVIVASSRSIAIVWPASSRSQPTRPCSIKAPPACIEVSSPTTWHVGGSRGVMPSRNSPSAGTFHVIRNRFCVVSLRSRNAGRTSCALDARPTSSNTASSASRSATRIIVLAPANPVSSPCSRRARLRTGLPAPRSVARRTTRARLRRAPVRTVALQPARPP